MHPPRAVRRPTKVFTIAAVNDRHVKNWTPPAIATLRGTALGAVDTKPIEKDRWRQLPAEEQFDAVLYLGQGIAEPEPLSKTLCDEPGYVEMRLKRIAIAGLPPAEVQRVTSLCGL